MLLASGDAKSIFGGGGGKKKKNRGECKKMHMKCAKIYHFYVEIVKFGLILTHLKLLGGKHGGKNVFWGGKCPAIPLSLPPLLLGNST